MDCLNLTEKISVITGASSGIGQGTAEKFAKLGSRLALIDKDEENLPITKAKCISSGSLKEEDVLCIKADLTIDSDIDKAVDKILDNFKTVHVLVNCAAIFSFDSIETVDMMKYDQITLLNVRSMIYLTKLLTPQLLASRGSIVNVSSVAGTRPVTGAMTYSQSKSAVNQFTRCTALDLASRGVRVNAVNPGFIDTPIFTKMGLSNDELVALMEHCKSTHPLGRTGKVADVAGVIAFLASDAASFITGATIPVDGGYHATCSQ